MRAIAFPSLTRTICRTQIPIAHAALPTHLVPRFRPLEAFGRRPAGARRTAISGRHPKAFTFSTEAAEAARPIISGFVSKAEVNSHHRCVSRCADYVAKVFLHGATKCRVTAAMMQRPMAIAAP
jgi:hypothetical protein